MGNVSELLSTYPPHTSSRYVIRDQGVTKRQQPIVLQSGPNSPPW